ncbi:hypothetical protein AAX08_01125 [Moraxella bovoculi]|nr:hypothetical protein AAX08_01125 [Moraxella bovoculi]
MALQCSYSAVRTAREWDKTCFEVVIVQLPFDGLDDTLKIGWVGSSKTAVLTACGIGYFHTFQPKRKATADKKAVKF